MIEITSGVDLIRIDRFSDIKPAIRERFLKRVFTMIELLDCKNGDEHLAGRFAAKEAASKALGCGIGEVSWQEIEILVDEKGKPVLCFHGRALEIARQKGWKSWSVSISHTAEIALAGVFALIENE